MLVAVLKGGTVLALIVLVVTAVVALVTVLVVNGLVRAFRYMSGLSVLIVTVPSNRLGA